MYNLNMELIRLLDKLLLSKNETVMDSLKQAVVLAEVTDEPDTKEGYYPLRGPIEELVFTVQSMQQTLGSLQNQINNMQNTRTYTGTGTGTYPGTVWSGGTGNYTTTAPDWSMTGYSTGSIAYPSTTDLGNYITEAYNNITIPNGGYNYSGAVTEAMKDDPDAWDLIDPDTGTVMTVKYK